MLTLKQYHCDMLGHENDNSSTKHISIIAKMTNNELFDWKKY